MKTIQKLSLILLGLLITHESYSSSARAAQKRAAQKATAIKPGEKKPTQSSQIQKEDNKNNAPLKQTKIDSPLNTALGAAIIFGETDSIQKLLDMGANPTVGLAFALDHPGNEQVIELLLQAGAQVDNKSIQQIRKDIITAKHQTNKEQARSWYDWFWGIQPAQEEEILPYAYRITQPTSANIARQKQRAEKQKEMLVQAKEIKNDYETIDRDYEAVTNDNYQLEKPFSQALKEDYPQALTDTRTENEQAADLTQAEQDYDQAFAMNY